MYDDDDDDDNDGDDDGFHIIFHHTEGSKYSGIFLSGSCSIKLTQNGL